VQATTAAGNRRRARPVAGQGQHAWQGQ
jgi:hypothetical protein